MRARRAARDEMGRNVGETQGSVRQVTHTTHYSHTLAEAPKFGTPHAARSSTTRPGRAEGCGPLRRRQRECTSESAWYLYVPQSLPSCQSLDNVIGRASSWLISSVQGSKKEQAATQSKLRPQPKEVGTECKERPVSSKGRLRAPNAHPLCPAFPFIFGTVQLDPSRAPPHHCPDSPNGHLRTRPGSGEGGHFDWDSLSTACT
jgi:hypothetical protein